MLDKVWVVAKKELNAFFSSPVAFIFIGTFLVANLFLFFWIETFFARNIADVRPLFSWMPILLVFLVASLTMKMWTEERRLGTLELMLTFPISTLQIVVGKFVACLFLVGIALILTLPLPITVSMLGELDWGPVVGGYVATIFLAGAYASIGLFVSARTDNQIVSLIVTVLSCGLFYLLGSDAFAAFFGNQGAEVMRLIGTGSRFESITRGVIDLRDIYYYLSLIGIFLALNVFSVNRLRWSREVKKPAHQTAVLATSLIVVNLLLANVWLQKTVTVRADLTAGSQYSISPATTGLIGQLREPLLIRGYFSEKTHPLLAPLVPQLRDLIREYEVASGGTIRSEFIDPREHPELEEEANTKYGIRPVPFQVADKYQSALVNSYFDILIQYGDKSEVLNFRDLIEVKVQGERDLSVMLRNPEYDITRSLKKVLYGFQNIDDLFASLTSPIQFRGYFSEDRKLPAALQAFEQTVVEYLTELKQSSNGKLSVEIIDPDADGGAVANEIQEQYGFRPMRAGLFSTDTFYFYMTMQGAGEILQVPLPEDLNKEGLKRSVESALKRFSPGFLKTVGLVARQGQGDVMGKHTFNIVSQKLGDSHLVTPVDLQSGVVPESVDLLVVLAPEETTKKQLFAIDQFLMKGGTTILATSPYTVERSESGLTAKKVKTGLEEWLDKYGVSLKEAFVLDEQNERYPTPVRRQLGAFTVDEMVMREYPFFVDLRGAGINSRDTLAAGISQVTLNWPSPVEVNSEKNSNRKVTELLKSSAASWSTSALNVSPNYQIYPELGFLPEVERQSFTLGVVVEGEFESGFKGENSPLFEVDPQEKTAMGQDEKAPPKTPVAGSVVEKSPGSSRLIIFASNEFLSDQTAQISMSAGGSSFINSLSLLENALDWSLEDRDLLSIRSRAHFGRTLAPLRRDEQLYWEYLNYGLAIAGVFLIWLIVKLSRAQSRERQLAMVQAIEAV